MSRGTPSIYSEPASERERVEPGTPSARSSRLAISRASPTSTAGETMRTVRADDQGGEKVYWARNERVAISSAGQLPREVQALVKDSGGCSYAVDNLSLRVKSVLTVSQISPLSLCQAILTWSLDSRW
jgi:hypothetical protein